MDFFLKRFQKWFSLFYKTEITITDHVYNVRGDNAAPAPRTNYLRQRNLFYGSAQDAIPEPPAISAVVSSDNNNSGLVYIDYRRQKTKRYYRNFGIWNRYFDVFLTPLHSDVYADGQYRYTAGDGPVTPTHPLANTLMRSCLHIDTQHAQPCFTGPQSMSVNLANHPLTTDEHNKILSISDID